VDKGITLKKISTDDHLRRGDERRKSFPLRAKLKNIHGKKPKALTVKHTNEVIQKLLKKNNNPNVNCEALGHGIGEALRIKTTNDRMTTSKVSGDHFRGNSFSIF